MPEKPKKRPNDDAHDEEDPAEDQKKRGYYYDDAYGYEKYDPKKDEDESEEARNLWGES